MRRPPLRPSRPARRPAPEALEGRLCLSTTAPNLLGRPAGPEVAAFASAHRPGPAAVAPHPDAGRAQPAHPLGGYTHAGGGYTAPLRSPPGYTAASLHEDGGPDHEEDHGRGHGALSRAGLYPGINYTSWTPPDDNLAVSPTETILAVNEQIAFFDQVHSGAPLYGGVNLGLTSLFPNPVGGSVFDPRVTYDPASGGHFYLIALEQSSGSRSSYLDIAVSRTPTPSTNVGDWLTYRIKVAQTFGKTATWMDFAGLGYDQGALYASGNMFGFGSFGSFKAVKIVAFNKAAALLAGPSGGVTTPTNTKILTDGAFGLQPAVEVGAAPAEYLVESWGSSQVRVHALTNGGTAGGMTYSNATVNVPGFGTSVPKAPQLGSSNQIATNDARLINATWEGGHLYAAHTVQGTAESKAVAEWYDLTTNGMTPGQTAAPALARSGSIDPGTGISTFFPSIAVDASGDLAMSYAESSSGMYPSAYTQVVTATGATTTQVLQAGAAPYGGSRWGDYSGVVADPTTTGVFWASGEATLSSGSWGTWWTQVTTAPPAAPSAPTSLTATPDSAGPMTLTWSPVSGATGYSIFRKLSTDTRFPAAALIQVGAVTTVQNLNVAPGTSYDYAIEATNGNLTSPQATYPSSTGIVAASPNIAFQDNFATAGSFPGTAWNTTAAGVGATWTQDAPNATVSQTGTATGDPKKAFLTSVTNSASSEFIVRGLVHIDTWASGELARAGLSVLTDATTRGGYNLVLTGKSSNTGTVVGGSTTGTIVNPQVQFLDDGVTWGRLALTLPPGLTFQAGAGAPWYGFEVMMKNGVLYGAVWQSSTGTTTIADLPATWMGFQGGWTDHTSGAPGLDGGSSGTANNITSYATASFRSFVVAS